MFFYAQLSDGSICVGISQLSGPVDLVDMISIETLDAELIGKRYNAGVWEDVSQI